MWADVDGPGGPQGADEPLPEQSDSDRVTVLSPNGAELASLEAVSEPSGVGIIWETASEERILAFDL